MRTHPSIRSARVRAYGRVRVGLLAALALLAVMASPAMATTGHVFADQFGIPGSNDPGGFQGGPAGIAILQSTGDVFLSDPGHSPGPRIQRFDAAGVYQGEIAVDPALYSNPGSVAVDPSGAGAVYFGAGDNTAGTGTVLKYSAAGTFIHALDLAGSGTSLSNPSVAVDPVDGTVYVAATDTTSGTPVIDKFDASGAYLGKFDGATNSPDGGFVSIYSLAVDGSHRVYVVDGAKLRVDRYSADGTREATVDDGSGGGPGPAAVGADPVSDEVYVIENGPFGQQVAWFDAGGVSRLETFGAGKIAAAYGIAVNHSTGTVYTPDAGQGVVERFTTFTGPTVTTTAAASIDPTSETLNGTINPEGIEASYHFEYGQDTNYGTSTPEVSASSGNSAVPATGTASDLLPNTQYHVRIVGTNASGSIYGNDVTFTTAPAPPVLDGSAPFVSAIRGDGATLNGTLNPRGSDTTYHFDYGTTTAYGSATADAVAAASQGDQAVSLDATGLAPDTTYHFRLSADNGTGGVQTGVDQTFTTAPAAPGGATDITGLTATLTGTVNPRGSDTIYQFEWGRTTAYGNTTPYRDAGSVSEDVAVTEPIVGLTPGTTYHVRVVATDITTGAVTTGIDGTFTTQPPPAVTTRAVTAVTTNSATFSGQFNTHNLGGKYRFYVESSTSTYLGKTDEVEIGTDTTTGTATGTLTDLVPGQTYTVRLAVAGTGVTVYGDTVTFSTASLLTGQFPAPPATVNDPYGCKAPVLTPYDRHPKPGDTIKIAGKDLGVSGAVRLGSKSLKPTGWSPSGFKIALPDNATGTLPLTVNCGKVSNTIAIQIYRAPSNSFAASKAATRGITVTLRVKVPGPGSIAVRGASVKRANKHAGKAGVKKVKVTLTTDAASALAKSHRLAVPLKVRFTPTGGTARTKTVHVTFKRKAGR